MGSFLTPLDFKEHSGFGRRNFRNVSAALPPKLVVLPGVERISQKTPKKGRATSAKERCSNCRLRLIAYSSARFRHDWSLPRLRGTVEKSEKGEKLYSLNEFSGLALKCKSYPLQAAAAWAESGTLDDD